MAQRMMLRSAAAAGVALTALALSAATAAGAEAERPAEYYEQRAVEVQAYVEEHFAEAMPQAETFEVRMPTTDSGEFYDDQGYFFHWVEFEDAIGQTGLVLQYDEPGHYSSTPEQICEEDQEDGVDTCVVEELADGSTLVTSNIPVPGERDVLRVTHFRTDGSVTYGCGYNYDPIWDGDEGPLREDYSVTAEQLAQLVTDPELGL